MSDAEEVFKSERIKLSVSKFGQLTDPQSLQCLDVHKYIWTTKNLLTFEVITLDAAIVSLCVPDRNFATEELILGHGSLDAYFQYADQYLCSSVQSKPLKKCLQLSQRIWSPYVSGADLILTNVILNECCDMMVQVRFAVAFNNVIRISYHVTSNRAQILDTTHRLVLNLGGRLAAHYGTYDHVVQLNAESYYKTEGNRLKENNERNPAEDLADLRVANHIGMSIYRSDRKGFNGIYKLSERPIPKFDAKLIHIGSGRVMEVYSDFKWIRFSTMDDLPNPADSIAPFYGKLGIKNIEQIFDINQLINSAVLFVEGEESDGSLSLQRSGTINESEIRNIIDDVLLKDLEGKIRTLKEAGILTAREAREIIEDLLIMSLDRISESCTAELMDEESIRMLVKDIVLDILPGLNMNDVEEIGKTDICDGSDQMLSSSGDVAKEAVHENINEKSFFNSFQKHCGIMLQLRSLPFHRRCKRKSMFSQPNHVRKQPELVYNHSVVMKFGICKIPSNGVNKTRTSK